MNRRAFTFHLQAAPLCVNCRIGVYTSFAMDEKPLCVDSMTEPLNPILAAKSRWPHIIDSNAAVAEDILQVEGSRRIRPAIGCASQRAPCNARTVDPAPHPYHRAIRSTNHGQAPDRAGDVEEVLDMQRPEASMSCPRPQSVCGEAECEEMGTNGDSYCGIYCGACSVLVHGETEQRDAFIGCLKGVPDSELRCNGCKSDAVYAGCRICKLRHCAIQRGVAHCVECKDYPCATYKGWQRSSRFLPHVAQSGRNLDVVRRDGVDQWLASQRKHWSCPQCAASFSWYASECQKCGRSLANEAHALRGVRRLLCSWILPLVYRRSRNDTK